ncbi:hypothetical protein HPP92_026413 [Vanilla planifolia]|uniref:Uncharacterized protein n=1 Tax=Vanilla planifolia TaxID=51239 RepID=A0A835PG66_VANPL|nr:hypothetical protein HPP92_026637 [Vanilla planifolia]KAG0451067.1 hypothetical protein HPP92_026413 [Vanilla planifolia]
MGRLNRPRLLDRVSLEKGAGPPSFREPPCHVKLLSPPTLPLGTGKAVPNLSETRCSTLPMDPLPAP